MTELAAKKQAVTLSESILDYYKKKKEQEEDVQIVGTVFPPNFFL